MTSALRYPQVSPRERVRRPGRFYKRRLNTKKTKNPNVQKKKKFSIILLKNNKNLTNLDANVND